MRNHIEMLAILFEKYDARLTINSPDIANITETAFYESELSSLNEECLYIVSCEDYQSFPFMKVKANFLFINQYDYLTSAPADASANLITLDASLRTTDIYNSLQKCCRAFRTFKTSAFKLLRDVIDPSNLDSFLETAASILKSPITVFDKNYQIIALSKSVVTDQKSWNDFVNNGILVSAEERPAQYRFFQMKEFDFSNDSRPCIWGEGKDRWLLTKINIKCDLYYIMASVECDEKFGIYHQALFLYLNEIVEKYLKNQFRSGTYKELIASFFADVITNKEMNNEIILERAEKCGLHFGKRNYMALLYTKNESPIEMIRIAKYIRETTTFTAFTYDSNIIILCIGKDISYDFEREIRKLTLNSIFRKCELGISYSFSSALDLRKAYQQCRFAMRYDSMRTTDDYLYTYSSCNCFHLLSDAASRLNLSMYCHPVANEIISYDNENNTDYTITLFHYIRSFKNAGHTAKLLHIHRNTVNYRIERASSLFGLNMEDDQFLNNLRMALEIIVYTNPRILNK